ncbi:MAG: DUF4163 domain-containing protein [Candidatus Saccharibacteria bacterium]|nr:DUF4163 domain-containing protein [Candidatus Saccharibacteria bacterium]
MLRQQLCRKQRHIGICALFAMLLLAGCSSANKLAEEGQQASAGASAGASSKAETNIGSGSASGGTVSAGGNSASSGQGAGAAGNSGDAIVLLHPNLQKENYWVRYELPDESYSSFSCNVEGVVLSEEDKALYPALSERLDAVMEARESNAEEWARETSAVLDELYETYGSEMDESQADRYTKSYTSSVVRSDSTVLSIETAVYEYTGGAHPDHGTVFENYDPKSGRSLKLSDVVADKEALKEAVCADLRAQYPGDSDNIDFEAVESYIDELYDAEAESTSGGEEANYPPAGWSLDYFGLNIGFNPYSIAAYAFGEPRVSLTFAEHADLIKEPYSQLPQSYIVPIQEGRTYQLNAHTDGTGGMQLSVRTEPFDDQGDGSEGSIFITLDGRETEKKSYFYGAESYYVRHGDQDYLYSFLQLDNDWKAAAVFRLDADKIEDLAVDTLLNVRPGELSSDYSDEGSSLSENAVLYRYHTLSAVLTDPDAAYLSESVDMLSSYLAGRIYHIDPDTGLFVSDALLKPAGGHELTALRDIDAVPVDADGKETGALGDVVLPAGEKLSIYATDGESFVIFSYGNHQYAKVEVDRRSWPAYINGVPEDEVLEGMLYAG